MNLKTDSPKVDSYAWVILALIFFVSVAGPLNMAKVPPLMTPLREHFGISLTRAGWLMSIFSIIGVVMALPSGFVLGRLGAKNAGLIALGCLSVGSVLGAMTNSIPVLLFSRVLEGAGMCFMSILAPAVIAAWFPAEKRGLPMGIWAVWVPIGTIATYVLAPVLAQVGHWRWVWWLGAGYSVLLLVLYFLMFRLPPGAAVAKPVDTRHELENMRKALKNRDPWLIALSFGAINVVTIALNTYMPTFFETERMYSPHDASIIVSAVMAAGMFAVIFGGGLSDKLGTRRKCIAIPYIIVAAALPFLFVSEHVGIAAYFIIGVVGALGVTPTFSSAPEVVPPAQAGTSLAILTMGQNLGMFLGPLFFAMMVESFSWSIASYACVPFFLLGAVAAWFVRIR